MSSRSNGVLIAAMVSLLSGCSTPNEPVITPPQPRFADAAAAGSATDSRIYADVDPQHNAIDIEWKADSTGTTSGFVLYRAFDSAVDAEGLLAGRSTIAQFETSNILGESLPTSYRDTAGIIPGGTYWYQLQAFYRSPTNKVMYSSPTPVDLTTSFQYAERLIPDGPQGDTTPPISGLQFRWDNPDRGGRYQVIVQRIDNNEFVWSSMGEDEGTTTAITYPSTATPLLPGHQYHWRAKRILSHGGSSSPWITFAIKP